MFTRDELVHRHVGLVHYLARRLHNTLADDADLDELVSAGLGGLLAAADAFQAERGHAFATYAATRIRGAMLDELRRIDPLTRGARARTKRLEHVRDTLAQSLHRPANARELADALDTDLPGLLAMEREAIDQTTVSLDAPAHHHPSGDDRPRQEERLPAVEPDLDLELDRERERERLREALRSLDRAALEVLVLSFFEDRPLREIAPRIGVTESGASRIRSRALRQLRRHLTSASRVA